MIGLEIAGFAVGIIEAIWGVRADHLDIKKAKQEEAREQEKPTVYPLDEQLPPVPIEQINSTTGQPTGLDGLNSQAREGDLRPKQEKCS